MKNLFRTRKYLLLVSGIIFGIAIAAYAQHVKKGKGKVEVTENGIIIHPGARILPADEKALDDVLAPADKALAHARKKLYRIDTVENGTVTKQGALIDAVMTKELKTDVANAESQRGYTHRHVQIICPPYPCVTMFRPSVASAEDKKKLIEDLKPIIARIQKNQ